jgi:hypothetical protein
MRWVSFWQRLLVFVSIVLVLGAIAIGVFVTNPMLRAALNTSRTSILVSIPLIFAGIVAIIAVFRGIFQIAIGIIDAHKTWLRFTHTINSRRYSESDRARIEEKRAYFAENRNDPAYIERPQGAILRRMKRARKPKLMEIIGPVGSGKSRMVFHLVSLRLLDHYRGRVITLKWPAADPIPPNFDTWMIHEVATAIQKEDPHNPIEVDEPSTALVALQRYFADHASEPWLILIMANADIIPNPEHLSSLLGVRNTVVLAHPDPLSDAYRRQLSDAARHGLAGKMRFTMPSHMHAFSTSAAMQLFRNVLGPAAVHRRDWQIIAQQVHDTYPGFIVEFAQQYRRYRTSRGLQSNTNVSQRLQRRSLILASGDIEPLGDILLHRLGPDQLRLLATLAMFAEVRRQNWVVKPISTWIYDEIFDAESASESQLTNSSTARAAQAISACRRLGYVKTTPWRSHLRFTLFGQSMTDYVFAHPRDVTIANAEANIVARMRKEVRAATQHGTAAFCDTALPYILDFWSFVGLNPEDAVLFAHTLRDAFYWQGEWQRGYQRLQESLAMTEYQPRKAREHAEIALAIARLATALGKPADSMAASDKARPFFEPAGDAQAQAWLTHFQIAAMLLTRPENLDLPAASALSQAALSHLTSSDDALIRSLLQLDDIILNCHNKSLNNDASLLKQADELDTFIAQQRPSHLRSELLARVALVKERTWQRRGGLWARWQRYRMHALVKRYALQVSPHFWAEFRSASRNRIII